MVAPLPVVDPATLQSSGHHALRVPTTGWLRTWLTLSNPTVRSQTATLSAYDPASGRRLARITQAVGAETVKTVSLVTLLGNVGPTFPNEVRITVDHPGSPRSLLVSGAKLSRSGQVQSIPFFQDGQAHHNGTYPLLNVSRGAVSTTWLNLGAATAKVVAQLDWEGDGSYALPEISIAPGTSHRLDFAELIRNAKPDLLERELNSSYQKGFFRWSARGGSRKLLARTEVGPAEGGQFGFNCTGCCLEFPYGAIEPGSATFLAGSSASFVAGEYRNTCSGGLLGPYSATSPVLTVPSPFSWNGFTLRASGPGSGTLSFTATATRYEVISGICTTFTDIVAGSGPGKGFDFAVSLVNPNLQPIATGTPNNTTVRVQTTPAVSSQDVRLQAVRVRNSGGHTKTGSYHPDSTSGNVVGTFGSTTGTTNGSGRYETSYTAPYFGGTVKVQAVLLSQTNEVFAQIYVPSLFELGPGTNYVLIGFDGQPHHPEGTNHWGTSLANSSLVNIANAYKNQFYPDGIAQGKKLQYNDQSLTKGGKFDLPGNWSITADHQSHRAGRHCDVSSHNTNLDIANRKTEIENLFRDNGAVVGDEVASGNHWHLTF